MKYADKQLVRPRFEGGVDFGAGRRSILATRADGRHLLHVAGQKVWGGNGMLQRYSPSELRLWCPGKSPATGEKTIHEGRIDAGDWKLLSKPIFEHLGMEFSISLIALHATLLLDEPGHVDRPPPRDRSVTKRRAPKIELRSQMWYRFVERDDRSIELLIYDVIGRERSWVEVQLRDTSITRKFDIKSLPELGMGATYEEAKSLLFGPNIARVEEAEREVGEWTQRLNNRSADLTDLQERFEASLTTNRAKYDGIP